MATCTWLCPEIPELVRRFAVLSFAGCLRLCLGLDYAVCVEFQPEELHVRLFDVAFINGEHQPILQCYSHQVVQIFVVFGFCLPEHTHVVSNTYRSWALLNDAVHPLLEYVLGDVQAKQ